MERGNQARHEHHSIKLNIICYVNRPGSVKRERHRQRRLENSMFGEKSKVCVGGILVVNKSGGLTSRSVVDHVVRLVGRVKVGHAGTLDPLASGVLVVCIGPATRL